MPRGAGFRKWLEIGYAVGMGEKTIPIWAPCPPSKTQLERWRKEGSKPDEEPRTWFRLVPVFDASQVAPLPEFPGEPMPLELEVAIVLEDLDPKFPANAQV